MTKAKSKPCMACKHYFGGIPCAMNHRPRYFKDTGLRRVCDDFETTAGKITEVPASYFEGPSWIDRFMSIFGYRRA